MKDKQALFHAVEPVIREFIADKVITVCPGTWYGYRVDMEILKAKQSEFEMKHRCKIEPEEDQT